MKKLALIIALGCASLNAHAKTLTVGIDLSRSNPLLMSEVFSREAAKFAAGEILKLKHGDTVIIRGFGSRDVPINLRGYTFKISNKMRAPKVAGIAAQYIAALPKQEGISQSSTNLVAWLEFTPDFNCGEQSAVLVITDGLEASTYVEGAELKEGRKGLPSPDVSLKGCTVTFYGLGAGWPPRQVKTVRNQWRTFFKKADASFTDIEF